MLSDLMDLNSSETKSGIDASPSENDIFVWVKNLGNSKR